MVLDITKTNIKRTRASKPFEAQKVMVYEYVCREFQKEFQAFVTQHAQKYKQPSPEKQVHTIAGGNENCDNEQAD